MKRIFYIAAMAAMLFTACEKNGDPTNSDNREVSFAIDEVVTRVTTTVANGTTTSKFIDNDKIKINSYGLEDDLINKVYAVNGTSLSFAEEGVAPKPVYDGTKSATFVAHYPNNINLAENGLNMTVGSEQNTESKFHANMFMVAVGTGSPVENEGVVNFKFNHQMAMVKIKVTADVTVFSVTLDNIIPTVIWSGPENQSLTLKEDANTISILPWEKSDNEWWALVPAQDIQSTTKLVTIVTSAGDFSYTLANDLSLTRSKIHNINLTLSEKEVEASFGTEGMDPDWNEEEESIDDSIEYDEQALVLISEIAGDFTQTTTLKTVAGMGGISESSTEGWYYITGKSGFTASISDGTLNLCNASQTSWYNAFGAYYAKKEKVGTYELKFTLSATELSENVNNNKIELRLKDAQSVNVFHNFGGSQTQTVILSESDLKGEVYTVNKTFDVSITGEETGTAKVDGVDVTYPVKLDNGVVLVFSPKYDNPVSNSDPVTFMISNVTLKEKVVAPVQ